MAEVSTLMKVAFVLLGLGLLFHLVGFTTPYWHVQEGRTPRGTIKYNYGLWRGCTEGSAGGYRVDSCGSMISGDLHGYLRATQFFETVGFLAGIAAIVVLLLHVCVASFKDKRIFPILAAVAAVGAAGCIILGCIIFGASDYEKHFLSWAFAFALVGGLFFGIGGIIIFVATFVIKR